MKLGSLLPCCRVALALGLSMFAFAAPSFAAPSPTKAPTPVVTRAPDKGMPWSGATRDIASLGYVQEEYFIEGAARSYVPTGNLAQTKNGQWDALPTGPTAPYKVRIIVERPRDAAKFNGTVIVEWFNVTAMSDGGMFNTFGEWFTRQGYAYAGVSAQAAGVNHLRGYNAERYGTLAHPGDSYSYDIYSQAGQALKAGNILPLGDLTSRAKALIAWGGSQSGWRLITYANAIQPDTGTYDGIVPFVGGWAAPLAQAPLPAIAVPTEAGVKIRTDTKTPVLIQVSETEAMRAARGYHSQPDSKYFRLWEHAGAAHVSGTTARALGQGRTAAGGVSCENPPANGLSAVPIWHAMLNAMHEWVQNGRAPKSAPRMQLAIPADQSQPATAMRDPSTGLTKGGIRMPQIAAPVATQWGERPKGMKENQFCFLFGSYDPWNGDSDAWDSGPADISPKPEPSLRTLYRDNAGYVEAVRKSAKRLVARGWLLEDDVGPIIDEARAVQIN